MQTQWNNTTHNCYIASVSQQLGHALQLGEGLCLLLDICERQRRSLGATFALAPALPLDNDWHPLSTALGGTFAEGLIMHKNNKYNECTKQD